MALKRLLLGISLISAVMVNHASSQFEPTTVNQNGILILDALGQMFSVKSEGGTLGSFVFKELEATSNEFQFPFPIGKDFEFVGNPDGSPKGAYVLDEFGGQHQLTLDTTTGFISNPAEVGQNHPDFSAIPYFGWRVAEDIEIAPDWRNETFGYRGYFVLDADGVVHPVGDTNLPSYVYTDPQSGEDEIIETLFPGTIDNSGSEVDVNDILAGGVINYPVNRIAGEQRIDSVTPVVTYFGLGSGIARDLEISSEFVQLTVPSENDSEIIEERTVAMTNGYYIMDGFGAIHSSRLPLDFDVNNDGQILFDDMSDEDFGTPINNVSVAVPWTEERGDLPYFPGFDVAVDLEITPSGQGCYILDSYGSVFAVGDASFSFPPKFDEDGNRVPTANIPPFFGWPIARSLSIVTNNENQSLGVTKNQISAGLVVATGLGSVHNVGLAKDFNITREGNDGSPILTFSDTFRDVVTTPLWLAGDIQNEEFEAGQIAPPYDYFVVGDQTYPVSVAGDFRDVTAAFTTITAGYTPITGSF